jgi:hypothetical protein
MTEMAITPESPHLPRGHRLRDRDPLPTVEDAMADWEGVALPNGDEARGELWSGSYRLLLHCRSSAPSLAIQTIPKKGDQSISESQPSNPKLKQRR